jgi:hypothetical protein
MDTALLTGTPLMVGILVMLALVVIGGLSIAFQGSVQF